MASASTERHTLDSLTNRIRAYRHIRERVATRLSLILIPTLTVAMSLIMLADPVRR